MENEEEDQMAVIELPDDVRKLDVQMVRNIPGLLAKVSLEIHP